MYTWDIILVFIKNQYFIESAQTKTFQQLIDSNYKKKLLDVIFISPQNRHRHICSKCYTWDNSGSDQALRIYLLPVAGIGL